MSAFFYLHIVTMSIKEIPISGLNNKPPNFKKLNYPIPIHKGVQRPYFCGIFTGCRGSGKTFSCVRMLKNQEDSGFLNPATNEKTAIRHILYTSTLSGNPIWQSLKHLDDADVHEVYSDEHLEGILEDIKKERIYTETFASYVKAYKQFVKMTPEQYEVWEDKDAIILLMSYNFADPKHIKQPKYPHGVVTNVILDDMISSTAFARNRGNSLLKLVLNGRHYACNCLILTQALKSVSKPIRENTELFSFFAFKSKKVIEEDLYPLFGNLVTLDQFHALFSYATKNPHDALVIDLKDPDIKNRFKLNFDKVIRLTSVREDDTPLA